MFFNSMPQTLEEELNVNTDSLIFTVDQITYPGHSLRMNIRYYHYGGKYMINMDLVNGLRSKSIDSDSINKRFGSRCNLDTVLMSNLESSIMRNNYDIIIVQEHGSITHSELMMSIIGEKSLERLIGIIERYHSRVPRIIYFTEYASRKLYKKERKGIKSIENRVIHRDYDTVSCKKNEELVPFEKASIFELKRDGIIWAVIYDTIMPSNTVQEQFKSINTNLTKTKNEYSIEISPTNLLFNEIKINHPRWIMYKGGGHPSRTASYVFVCVFKRMITGKNIDEVSSKRKISRRKARIIRDEVNDFFSTPATERRID
ncbi:MAG: hypothetical protein COA33_012945 [Fluviicola sp.]|nr:hypothetical protein [Fluviicola sp.]